jgi:hypothetical protein
VRGVEPMGAGALHVGDGVIAHVQESADRAGSTPSRAEEPGVERALALGGRRPSE